MVYCDTQSQLVAGAKPLLGFRISLSGKGAEYLHDRRIVVAHGGCLCIFKRASRTVSGFRQQQQHGDFVRGSNILVSACSLVPHAS